MTKQINLEEVKEFVLQRTLKNIETVQEKAPVSVREGQAIYASDSDWRLGFWGGILQYCYLLSRDERFLQAYHMQRPRLLKRLYHQKETLDHDIGFIYMPTEYARFKLSADNESRAAVLEAADELLRRFNEKGRFIRAWDWDDGSEFASHNNGRMIIDCMLNLPLLFEASRLSGDEKYHRAAEQHAETCADTIVRADGTTYHTYRFDVETGAPVCGETWQGASDESCWSRGQSWAVTGFTMAYRYTKNERFLKTAVQTADTFLLLSEENDLPAWDFAVRGQGAPYDASAAAVACCGLLELAGYVGEEKGRLYREWADKLFAALWNECAVKSDDGDYTGIITHATGFYRMNSEIDTHIIYADYYFIKAMARYLDFKWFV